MLRGGEAAEAEGRLQGAGHQGPGVAGNGDQFSCGVTQMSGDKLRLRHPVNVLNASALFTLKWVILGEFYLD